MQHKPPQQADDDALRGQTRASDYDDAQLHVESEVASGDRPTSAATGKLGWAPLQTASIPRVTHDARFEHDRFAPSEVLTALSSRSHRLRRWVGAALILVGFVGFLFNIEGESAEPLRPAPRSTPVFAQNVTLISTEPPGAELLADGRVFGNTPVLMPRPALGEKSYTLRLWGYELQSVRLTSKSGAAIQIALTPLGDRDHPHLER